MSCMNRDNADIVHQANIQSDVIVINQCDRDGEEIGYFVNKYGERCRIDMIYTTERGLSRSRNMAIRKSEADICLFCDDDEVFEDDYVRIVRESFESDRHSDIVAFALNYFKKQFPDRDYRIGYVKALSVVSLQIAFLRRSVVDNGIGFDVEMGSGTGHGAGEENKFMFDCLRKRLTAYYDHHVIATVPYAESNWFKGFTPTFFYNRGWATKRYLGKFWATIYAFYYSVRKYPMYRRETAFLSALSNTLHGVFSK